MSQKQVAGRLPDFIIIGAAKSGTSSLHEELSQHPNVFMSTPKEPCFFDEDVAWKQGVGWYSSIFDDAGEGQICGESSTNYTRWPQVPGVPEKMHNLIPKAKLIYVMRDPVYRAYSHYVHRWTKELHPNEPFRQTFSEFVETDPMCIDGGKYYEQLEQYLSYYTEENLFLIVLEDLVANRERVIAELYDFLGIENLISENKALPKANENKSHRYHTARMEVSKKYLSFPPLRYLASLVPAKLKNLVYDKVLSRHPAVTKLKDMFEPPAFSELEKKELREFYAPHNAKLSRKFKIDVSAWGI